MSHRESWQSGAEEWVQRPVDAVAEHSVESAEAEQVGISRGAERVSGKRSRGLGSGPAWQLTARLGISGGAGSGVVDSARLRRGEQQIQLRCESTFCGYASRAHAAEESLPRGDRLLAQLVDGFWIAAAASRRGA